MNCFTKEMVKCTDALAFHAGSKYGTHSITATLSVFRCSDRINLASSSTYTNSWNSVPYCSSRKDWIDKNKSTEKTKDDPVMLFLVFTDYTLTVCKTFTSWQTFGLICTSEFDSPYFLTPVACFMVPSLVRSVTDEQCWVCNMTCSLY